MYIKSSAFVYTAEKDLSDVFEAVHGLREWKRLGLILGLLHTTLTNIETHRKDKPDDCMMDMLAAWLKQQDNVSQKGVPSWLVLQAALRRMGENELADRISTGGLGVHYSDGVCCEQVVSHEYRRKKRQMRGERK